MKRIVYILVCFFLFTQIVHAEYILPYPGPMPGNKLYKISSIWDKFQKYWNWGSIAKIKYYESLSDKSLVETKILWEYKQYLLGTQSLLLSDKYIQETPFYVKRGFTEGKDMQPIVKNFAEENRKHEEILLLLKNLLPQTFNWSPEKEKSQVLYLHQMIDESISIRRQSTAEVASFLYCTRMISSQKTNEELATLCKDSTNLVTEYMYQEILK